MSYSKRHGNSVSLAITIYLIGGEYTVNAHYYAPVATIFRPDGITPDWEGNQILWDFVISHGVDGIVLMGSTGEFFSMTLDTQKSIIDFAARTLLGRTKIIVGVSRMNIEETQDLCQYAVKAGFREVMLISPYYFSLTQEDLKNYYTRISEQTDAQIYLYNFPARTGHDLSPELVKYLAMTQKNIIGLKDTVENYGHTRTIIQMVKPIRPEFEIFTGYDEYFSHCAMSGGDGCIGGLANLFPEKCSQWREAVQENDFDMVCSIQKFIDCAMQLYTVSTPFLPALKYALQLRSIPLDEVCTFPIQKLSVKKKRQLEHLMTDLEKMC